MKTIFCLSGTFVFHRMCSTVECTLRTLHDTNLRIEYIFAESFDVMFGDSIVDLPTACQQCSGTPKTGDQLRDE